MNALTQIERDLLEPVLAGFDVGKLLRYWPAANGIENSNYFVSTSTGEYVLTVLEQPSAAGDSYLTLLETLDKAGLPVPAPIAQSSGSRWAHVAGKPALLQAMLPGRHQDNPTNANLESVGRFLARMHVCTQAIAAAMPEYPRDLEWLESTSERVMPFMAYSQAAELQTAMDTLSSLLHRQDVGELPSGVIHGDLFRDNVLFQENHLGGVLDFHHASFGFLIYDLGVVANDWCCDTQGRLDPEKTLALLRAYHSVRPLSRQELWFFPVFALYAGCAFWLSRLNAAVQSKLNQPAGSVRLKNPDEFHQIVRQHNAHFLYLDERQIARN